MGKIHLSTGSHFILPLVILTIELSLAVAADVSKMTIEELKAQLDSSDIMILDVRTGGDWKSSEFKIKGAIRANPKEFDKWAEVYPKNKILILYCS